MKAKINERILCIPPYLSTTWDQVLFLNAEEDMEKQKMDMTIHLIDGKVATIKGLEPSLVDIAFSAHMQYLEKNDKAKVGGNLQNFINDQIMAFPIRFGISSIPPNMANVEGFEMALQHNPSQAHSPNLPAEVIEKIATIAKVITNGDLSAFPKPEPHCNCMHCQVARVIHKTADANHDEEPATEEDLKFRTWDILQTGEKLFTVSNPIDPKEQYNVFLGTPVGCTCGSPHCEHIKAVLYS